MSTSMGVFCLLIFGDCEIKKKYVSLACNDIRATESCRKRRHWD
jgi:hypothetical protein